MLSHIVEFVYILLSVLTDQSYQRRFIKSNKLLTAEESSADVSRAPCRFFLAKTLEDPEDPKQILAGIYVTMTSHLDGLSLFTSFV